MTVDMKTTVALIVAFLVYFVAGSAVAVATGPFDIYASASFVLLIPYGAFLYFCRKGKSWAYLASSILSVFLIIVIPINASLETWAQTTPYLNSMATIAVVLFGLLSVEGFRSYLQLKKA